MLAKIGMNPDVVFLISKVSDTFVSSALGATDDDTRGGVPATFDGRPIAHRLYHKTPGMVAMHGDDNLDMTAAHEFSHAFSSYTNGYITDLYRDGDQFSHPTFVINRKQAGPFRISLAEYNGIAYRSDKTRNSLATAR